MSLKHTRQQRVIGSSERDAASLPANQHAASGPLRQYSEDGPSQSRQVRHSVFFARLSLNVEGIGRI